MNIHLNIPHYNIDIIKISNERYELAVTHKATQEKKVFYVDEEIIESVDFDDLQLRMNINLSNRTYIHFNFESEKHITADIYDDYTEEHLD